MTETIVWLARHAETATPSVFHGAESDVELGEHGLRQVDAAVEYYRDVIRPNVIVSSAMRRAVDTAGVLAKACGVEHVIRPELHERRVGELGGTSFRGSDGPWPTTIREWCAGNANFTTTGAESFRDLQHRLVPAVQKLTRDFEGQRVGIIAHGVVCKVLILSLLPEWGIHGWERLGHCLNLSTSELRWSGHQWHAGPLLVLPPGVKAVNDERDAKVKREVSVA